MRINPHSGTFELPESGAIISQSLTKNEFLSSVLAKASRLQISNESYASYSILLESEFGKLGISLDFEAQRLNALRIEKIDPKSSWINWSEQKELQRKKELDDILIAMLGEPPYNFSWGEVSAFYDPKSGSAGITIRYSHLK